MLSVYRHDISAIFYSFIKFSLKFMKFKLDNVHIQPSSTTAMFLNKFDIKFSFLG